MNTINDIPLDQLLAALKVTMGELRSKERTQHLTDARAIVATILHKHCRMRQQDIALILDTTQGAVSKMLERHQALLQNPSYQNKFNLIKISIFNL
jgi:chromosomal replication initiation ATPase DnaA